MTLRTQHGQPCELQQLLEEVAKACLAEAYDDALNRLLDRLSQSRDSAADLVFICACIVALAGDPVKAKNFALSSLSMGGHTEAAVKCGGRIFLESGSRGERCRLFFSQNRLWPIVHVASLNPAVAKKSDLVNFEPWYFSKEKASIFPRQREFAADLNSDFIKKHVLFESLPDRPLFTADAKILTVGSCFAEELRNYFLARNLSTNVVFIPPGLNNTFALDSYFRWMLTGDDDDQEYWFDVAKTGGVKWSPAEDRARLVSLMHQLDCIVVTVGLAEVWSDTSTGKVFWRGVPRSKFDSQRHVCRVSTVEENQTNLESLFRSLRALSPKAEVIFSLSPIPLAATQSGVSCITADSLSKATLRIALDSFLKQKPAGARYWPSFEIVRWLGSHVEASLFGEDGNSRHVNRSAVDLILGAFVDAFFSKSATSVSETERVTAS
jgi:hypothetical protein